MTTSFARWWEQATLRSSSMNKPRPRPIAAAALSVSLFLLLAPQVRGYDKEFTYNHDNDSFLFAGTYLNYPHGWLLVKAVELLGQDGYTAQANMATSYLLPMLEGAMWNDVWGDADLAGTSMLDYYCPERPDQNYGFGSAAAGVYKHATWDFQCHDFYGYGNAAEYSQNRYDYARRVFLGHWGDDARDLMAGWVAEHGDRISQFDPIDGNYFHTAGEINQPHFDISYTPAEALQDLLGNHCRENVIFPGCQAPWSSSLFIPAKTVFDNAPGWFNQHLGAHMWNDAIEAYCGFDGVDSAVYANWTTDSGGDSHCSPFVFYVPVNSLEHSFFLLGWAIHLVDDNSLVVHTIDGSLEAWQIHNDIEEFADRTLQQGFVYHGHAVKDSLPTGNLSDFEDLYPWPPPTCESSTPNPRDFYKDRWYAEALQRDPGEGVAHAYVRNSAVMVHQFYPYVQASCRGCPAICINTRDLTWDNFGFLTAFELDLAIKTTAGLLHQFFVDVGMLEGAMSDSKNGPLNDPALPYEIVGDVVIPAGQSRTIGPGVTIKLDPGMTIQALGTLTVSGSSTAPVRLVSSVDGQTGIMIGSQFVLRNGGILRLP